MFTTIKSKLTWGTAVLLIGVVASVLAFFGEEDQIKPVMQSQFDRHTQAADTEFAALDNSIDFLAQQQRVETLRRDKRRTEANNDRWTSEEQAELEDEAAYLAEMRRERRKNR